MGWRDYVPFMGKAKEAPPAEKPKRMCCACPETKVCFAQFEKMRSLCGIAYVAASSKVAKHHPDLQTEQLVVNHAVPPCAPASESRGRGGGRAGAGGWGLASASRSGVQPNLTCNARHGLKSLWRPHSVL